MEVELAPWSLNVDCRWGFAENTVWEGRGKSTFIVEKLHRYWDQGQHRRWPVMFVVCTLDMRASQVALAVKNLAASAGDIRDASSVLGSGRSPGGGHGNPLQYSCLENPMDKGVWWAIVHRVAENQTQLKRLSTHTPLIWCDEKSPLPLRSSSPKPITPRGKCQTVEGHSVCKIPDQCTLILMRS